MNPHNFFVILRMRIKISKNKILEWLSLQIWKLTNIVNLWNFEFSKLKKFWQSIHFPIWEIQKISNWKTQKISIID